jgi:hypothetical protein
MQIINLSFGLSFGAGGDGGLLPAKDEELGSLIILGE